MGADNSVAFVHGDHAADAEVSSRVLRDGGEHTEYKTLHSWFDMAGDFGIFIARFRFGSWRVGL